MNNTYTGDGFSKTLSGKVINLRNPDISCIDIDDIAHGLARICRFNGQIQDWYSVAEHSVRVSEDVPDEWKLEALMHDATEAYIQDIIRPLKYMDIFNEYRKLEKIWELAIVERFHLQWPFDATIHRADQATQEWERVNVKFSYNHVGMERGKAEKYFKAAFIQYSNQRGLYEIFREEGTISI
jgi:hypothetical protein